MGCGNPKPIQTGGTFTCHKNFKKSKQTNLLLPDVIFQAENAPVPFLALDPAGETGFTFRYPRRTPLPPCSSPSPPVDVIWAVMIASDLGLVKGFCVFFLPQASSFIPCFGVFSLVCFELSVPVQVIAWKDSSPKWPRMFRAVHKTTHSLTRHARSWCLPSCPPPPHRTNSWLCHCLWF